MDKKLLALQLFKRTANSAVDAGEKAAIDYQDLFLTILGKFIDVLEGAVIIAAGFILARFLRHYFAKIEVTHERQRTALNLLEKITNGFVVVMAITLGLRVIGLDITLIVSVITLGLSFGLRDVIKNYVAGILILFKSPFEIGDTVKIRSFTGKITKIEFQAVTMTTFDNKEVTIHNKDLLTQPITNFSKSEWRRLEIDLKLGYGSDLQKTLAVVDRILQNDASVLKKPKYSILFKTFSDTGSSLSVRFWAPKNCNFLKLRTGLALKMQEAFDEANLFAPYAREAGLSEMFGMTEERRERLKAFYNQPILADLAAKTVEQIAGAIAATGATATAIVPIEDYADADEPE